METNIFMRRNILSIIVVLIIIGYGFKIMNNKPDTKVNFVMAYQPISDSERNDSVINEMDKLSKDKIKIKKAIRNYAARYTVEDLIDSTKRKDFIQLVNDMLDSTEVD
jgi:hypothetical protein